MGFVVRQVMDLQGFVTAAIDALKMGVEGLLSELAVKLGAKSLEFLAFDFSAS